MKEMHPFREARREALPTPDFQGPVTMKLLLEFLYALREWLPAAPRLLPGVEPDGCALYALYADAAFPDGGFRQTFGGYLAVLGRRWQIDLFGSDLFTQETAALAVEQTEGNWYAVQRTVSGRYADSIGSLCLRVGCADAREAGALYALCRGLDWQSGVLAADWGLRGLLEAEQIPPLYPDSCYCYGDVSGAPSGEKCLEALDFARRKGLWLAFLDRGFDFAEFAWLYDGIARRALRSRTQWELALYAALRQLRYTLKISESEFALYDGNGARRYFGFNSDQNAQRALLKLLFPLNTP